MKTSRFRWGGLVAILVCVALPLLADEPASKPASQPVAVREIDRPDVDVLLLQEAAREAVAAQDRYAKTRLPNFGNPNWHLEAEMRITHQIALSLARQGQFKEMFAYFDKFKWQEDRTGYPTYMYKDFWDPVGEDAFRRNDFRTLAKFLPYVPRGVSHSVYNWDNIITRCLELGRDEEVETWGREFAKQDKEKFALSHLDSRRKAYALLKREKGGTLSPGVLRTAFRLFDEYNWNYDRLEMPLAVYALCFNSYRRMSVLDEKLPEAVRLTREGKNDQAKALYK